MPTTILFEGTPSETFSMAVGDVAAGIPAEKLESLGRRVKSGIVTVEDQPVRIAFGGAVPTSGPDGVGHYQVAGSSIELRNYAAVSTFRVINYLAGNDASLRITLEF